MEQIKFIYHDHSKCTKKLCISEIIFTCVASSIVDSDKQFELKFHKHPSQLPNVGCELQIIK